MARRTVLIIEDDHAIRRGIVDAVAFSGFDTLEASTGPTGLKTALECTWDILLLDLLLPGMDGLEILSELKRARPTAPVIILTARGEESDRVKGLELGADDYVVKPFSIRELLARMEAVLRRSPERPTDVPQISITGATVDFSLSEIRFEDGERIEISERESELLRYLAIHADRVVTRDELIFRVWRLNPKSVHTRAIDMHIARLRSKLRDDSAMPEVIKTVRGKGYMFVAQECG